ncbi:IS66 family transposase [Oceanisphaera ostreae]|uniref:IS66 family transposase n=1 Tax=Oceanisphaera ostreae TaxID=914151 RepID=A0ABW3KFH0_9GAMM
MKKTPSTSIKTPDLSGLSAAELRLMLAKMQQEFQTVVDKQKSELNAAHRRIELLEEMNRLLKTQKFSASSEKSTFQLNLFDEAELETQLDELFDVLPETREEGEEITQQRKARQTRQRGFSANLVRERIEHTLTELEKAGADKTFFTKVKEELHYIPAQLKVLEHWQEKAVFTSNSGAQEDQMMAAQRPVHPFGKCSVTTALIAHIITDKYLYGMPLYRQEGKFKRLGQAIYRNNMAQWCMRFADTAQPLLHLMREAQNSGDYLQADETRLQVLKEDGKTAQSDKWMWVTRGGPPSQLSVLFEYDPSRAGSVAVRLLDDFNGVLQADGYSGYSKVCKTNGIIRIGCWDHARRKFVEANKSTDSKDKAKNGVASKADVALSYIRKLYRVESNLADKTDAARLKARQEISVPVLNEFKQWLETNVGKIMKGGALRSAIDYTLNQWPYLIGYCERGDLMLSNIMAENAIRPFAIGRKNWLFADTRKGAEASAACYSLIETAKANNLDPQAYIKHILDHIIVADTLEKLEALLPWNVKLS